MDQYLERLSLCISQEQLDKLKDKTVMVIGIGGVGGYVCEALARSGIGQLILVDNDEVSASNLNRQIIATKSNIGLSKTIAMKNRIEDISNSKVKTIDIFYNEDTNIITSDIDYVVDACDTMIAKINIIDKCHKLDIPHLACLGTGNRFNPQSFIYTTLDKTKNDPVARSMRSLVKKYNINYKVNVVVSSEIPHKQNTLVNPDGNTLKEKYPPSSNAFVPASAGLFIASIVFKDLIS